MEAIIKVTTIMQPRTWAKRDGGQGITYQFVGETQNDKYHKTIHFSVFGEERFNAMQLTEGMVYKVDFDIESKPWKDTYITNVSAWRVTPVDQQQAQQPVPSQQYVQQPSPAPTPATNAEPQQNNDDLPF